MDLEFILFAQIFMYSGILYCRGLPNLDIFHEIIATFPVSLGSKELFSCTIIRVNLGEVK